MPNPGAPVPYPPLPQVGTFNGQYALETTLQAVSKETTQALVKATLEALLARFPSAPANDRLKVETQLEQGLTQSQLAVAALASDAHLLEVLTLLNGQLNASTSSRMSEALGQQLLVKLGDIFGAVDGLEVTAGNIEINSSAISLNVDGVEDFLRQVRDRLPATLGQTTNAASLAVVLSVAQEAIFASMAQKLVDLNGKDFATQATLAAVLARLPTVPVGDRLKVTLGNAALEAAVRARGVGGGAIAALETADDCDDMQCKRLTLVADTNTAVDFAQTVRIIRVVNWDIVNEVLVKTSPTSSLTDVDSTSVGAAPAAGVPNSRTFVLRRAQIHLRSAGASRVNVEGMF